MEPIEKQEAIFKEIDPILKEIDMIIPPSWSRNQVAAVFGVYIEIYK